MWFLDAVPQLFFLFYFFSYSAWKVVKDFIEYSKENNSKEEIVRWLSEALQLSTFVNKKLDTQSIISLFTREMMSIDFNNFEEGVINNNILQRIFKGLESERPFNPLKFIHDYLSNFSVIKKVLLFNKEI